MKKITMKLMPSAQDDQSFAPSYATPGSAGMDIKVAISAPKLLYPKDRFILPLGFAMDIQDTGLAAVLMPRSGLGSKQGIVLGNLIGLIDSDYQGEVKVCIWNTNSEGRPFKIRRGDVLAQMVFVPVVQAEPEWVTEFESETERGEGGFGSTNTTVEVEAE